MSTVVLPDSADALTRSNKYALATGLILLVASVSADLFINSVGDKDWLLYAARSWLGGKKLYVDIVEVNPPLIIWLYAIPVWLSSHLVGLRDFTALGLMGLIGSGISVGLSAALLFGVPSLKQASRERREILFLLALIFIFLTPQRYFFDRDHILLVMTFPYILRFMPSVAGEKLPAWTRLAIGLAGALGFCIKPHSVILFVTVQLLVTVRDRSFAILWSLENLIIGAAALLYFCSVAHATPEYLTLIFPMALATYSSFEHGGSSFIHLPLSLFCAGFTFADFRWRFRSPYRNDIYYFIGITLAFLLYAAVSGGWDYTYYALECCQLFLTCLVLYEYRWLQGRQGMEDGERKRFILGARGCVISLTLQGICMVLMVFSTASTSLERQICDARPACTAHNPYVRYMNEHHIASFGTITQDYTQWLEIMSITHARWETRFNHLWMLPKLLHDETERRPERSDILDYIALALAQDLNRNRPEIVFVLTGREFSIYPDYIDVAAFLSRVPAFKDAWSNYRFSATFDRCAAVTGLHAKTECKYDVYTRILP